MTSSHSNQHPVRCIGALTYLLGYVHISHLALGVRAVAHMQVSAGSEMFMLAGLAQRQLSDVEVAEVVYSAQGRLAAAPEGRRLEDTSQHKGTSLPPTQREIEGAGGEMWYEARHFGAGRAA